jgi:hypothetical protein
MNKYSIEAELGDQFQMHRFRANDDEQAMFYAVHLILDFAKKKDLWANGLITLRDWDGVIVNQMPAKITAPINNTLESDYTVSGY